MRLCDIEGCNRDMCAGGLCMMHYQRQRRATTVEERVTRRERQLLDLEVTRQARYWERVDQNGPLPDEDTLAAGLGPCWLWTGAIGKQGYGRISSEPAHRWSFRFHTGKSVKGMHVDHLCRNRACVNPRHLEAVTPGENTRRGVRARSIKREKDQS